MGIMISYLQGMIDIMILFIKYHQTLGGKKSYSVPQIILMTLFYS